MTEDGDTIDIYRVETRNVSILLYIQQPLTKKELSIQNINNAEAEKLFNIRCICGAYYKFLSSASSSSDFKGRDGI